jgi:hypothetical protein
LKKINLYKFLFEDKDVNDKDATEAEVSVSGSGLKSRQSKDSVDDQIDSLILKYEYSSIDEKEDDALMESILKQNLKYLLTEQDEDIEDEEEPADDAEGEDEDEVPVTADPTGSENVDISTPNMKEVIPNLNIDKFTKRCVRLIINHRNLLRIEEAIINRAKNFLDEHYGDAYVTDFLNVLESQHGITIEEFNDEVLNSKEQDTPFAVGANASGAGGAA